ncbi:MAG TPA: MFS transporter [Candidatus Binataceae bacterium]|nr:MFS transporter [Candidatus Binataceae bacterium]
MPTWLLVPLGYLVMAIAIARSLDALSNPLMSWISDHTHTRLGRRRPYMLAGPLLCGVAFFCLLNPPQSLTGGRAAIWFGAMFVLYFMFHGLCFATLRTGP